LSVNFLCLIGAMIGLGSIFIPWTWVEAGLWHSDVTLLDTLHFIQIEYFTVAGLVFAVGTVIAFAFPIACGIQIAGVIGFYHFWAQHGFTGGVAGGLSIGYLLAILSCAIVAVSVVWPAGPGYSSSRARRSVCIQIAHRTGSERSRADGPSSTVAGGVLGDARNTRQWIVALAAAASLVVLALGVANSTYKSPEPLVEVNGGVMAIIGQGTATPFGSWNGSELIVSDGIENVTWILQNESWGPREMTGWNSVSFEAKNLSGLILTPTVVNWLGYGYILPGDQVVLVAEWHGQSRERFAEGTTYTMSLIAEPPPVMDDILYYNLIAIRDAGYRLYSMPLGFEITFEFLDGRLSSECQTTYGQGDPLPDPFWTRAVVITAIIALALAIVAVYWCGVIMRQGGGRDIPAQ